MKKLMLTVWVLGLAVVSSGAQAAFTCEQIKDKKTRASCIEDRDAKGDKSKELSDFVRKSKEALTRNFKDPDAAQFSDLAVSQSDFGSSLCGIVNGKNSYGGYIGKKCSRSSG